MTRIDQTDICLPKSSCVVLMLKTLRLVVANSSPEKICTMCKNNKVNGFNLMFLQMIFGNKQEDSEQGPSLFDKAAGMFSSMNRFMRIISK